MIFHWKFIQNLTNSFLVTTKSRIETEFQLLGAKDC